MKETYEAPIAEKIEFQYEEQIVASSCSMEWVNIGVNACTDGDQRLEYLN